jgi:hypothetical protein
MSERGAFLQQPKEDVKEPGNTKTPGWLAGGSRVLRKDWVLAWHSGFSGIGEIAADIRVPTEGGAIARTASGFHHGPLLTTRLRGQSGHRQGFGCDGMGHGRRVSWKRWKEGERISDDLVHRAGTIHNRHRVSVNQEYSGSMPAGKALP